jgi:hypothetical protein
MSDEPERFLSRWSRLKSEARQAPPAEAPQSAPAPAASTPAKEEEPPAPLPRPEDLTPESDFRPFMDARVDPATRRDALKRLFADARFNVPDPYEAYSEDYTIAEKIPEELLKTLNQARRIVFDEPEKTAQAAPPPADAGPESPTEAQDVAGRQDA